MTGAEFRAALAAMGMSQRAFAARLSLHEITVSRWVREERAVPAWVPSVLDLLDREKLPHSGTVLARVSRDIS